MKDQSSEKASLTSSDGLYELAAPCLEVFRQEGMAAPLGENLQLLLRWIELGRAGEQLAIVSPVCPDYSAKDTSDQQRQYDFERLNSGIGPMATRLYRSLAKLHATLRDVLQIADFRQFVCMCDFDGFYENNLRRVGETEAGFRAKVLQSCESLRRGAPAQLSASLLSDHCGGRAGWLRELTATRRRLAQMEGASEWESVAIKAIARERLSLYRRWLGREQSESLVEVLVTAQGIEYATAGRVIDAHFPNALVLTVGNDKWERFFRAFARLPVLCLQDSSL
ncbi:MAG TPA: hypothetical protein VI653_16615 [Steroidobacteraceae bacterium]